jgi:hypothetical protein
MQLVLSLGQTWDPAVMPALAQAAARFAHDPWMRRALLTSETGSSVAVLRALDRIDFFTGITPEQSVLVEEMGVVIGARRDMNQIADFLDLLVLHAEASAETWEVAALSGLTQGLVSQDAPIRFSPQVSTLLEELAEASSTTVKQVAEQLLTLSQS